MDLLEQHCREINRCNQRGGRMLSITDLLVAGTLSKTLAAYLLAAIGRGSSFMVGALPGGAGKTTLMGALLNFVPPGVELHPADSMPTIEWALKFHQKRCCYICHEVGSGFYYAYLWGAPLRSYFDLTKHGHMLATNLHADTIEEARRQICDENSISPLLFRKMNLLVFLQVGGGWGGKREVSEVWESDGFFDHQPVFREGQLSIGQSRIVTPETHETAGQLLEMVLASGAGTIEQVRRALIEPPKPAPDAQQATPSP